MKAVTIFNAKGIISVRKQKLLMSRFEQNRNANTETASKKALFKTGMSLAKGKAMKRSVTPREISLLLIGILVAIAVAFTLWINNPGAQSSTHSSIFPEINPISLKNIIYSGVKAFF